jgi:hypothetical protein
MTNSKRIAVLLTVPLMVMASLDAYSTRKVLSFRVGFPVLIVAKRRLGLVENALLKDGYNDGRKVVTT